MRRFVVPIEQTAQKIESTILFEFPIVLNSFIRHTWRLLYRESRDGFGSSNFHSKSDGVPNTITIILMTGGFIFGGFTPIAWDSSGNYKEDISC
jgi:hypothetical protein